MPRHTPNCDMPFTPLRPTATTTSGFKPYNPIQTTTPAEPPKKQEGIFSRLGKGVMDVALQPARFLERAGKQIGTIGLSPEQKKRYEEYVGPGLQESMLGKEYATPGYETLGQTAGGALQTASNLATPFVGSIGKIGLQGAALAGGKALEEKKDIGDAGTEAILGGSLSALTAGALKGAGSLVSKGIKPAVSKAARATVQKVMPYLTNIPKSDLNWAKDFSYIVQPKMKVVAEAIKNNEPEAAEDVLRSELLNTSRIVFNRAKQTAEKNYDEAVSGLAQKYAANRGSLEGMKESVRSLAKEAGEAVTADEEKAVNALIKTVDEHVDDTIPGFIALKRKLWPIMERTEQGTPARRTASLVYKKIDDELKSMTNGEIAPINKAYSEFKDAAFEVKPIWSESVKEDSARNFVTSLTGKAKTGSMAAVKKLEQLAGTGDNFAKEIKATRIAKSLNWEKAPPGSRMRDILVSNIIGSPVAALGAAVGGVPGALIGQAVGAGIGAKVTSPQYLSRFIFDEAEKQGVKMTPEIQRAIGAAISNPQFAQVMTRALGLGSAPQPKSE